MLWENALKSSCWSVLYYLSMPRTLYTPPLSAIGSIASTFMISNVPRLVAVLILIWAPPFDLLPDFFVLRLRKASMPSEPFEVEPSADTKSNSIFMVMSFASISFGSVCPCDPSLTFLDLLNYFGLIKLLALLI